MKRQTACTCKCLPPYSPLHKDNVHGRWVFRYLRALSVTCIECVCLISFNSSTVLARMHLLYIQIQKNWPVPPLTNVRMFSLLCQEQQNCPTNSRTSLMLSVNPFAWLEMIVVWGLFNVGCHSLIAVKNWVHPSLHSFTKRIPNAIGKVLQFAVVPY